MKPLIILDQHFRKLEELFRSDTYRALRARCDIIGGQNWPLPRAEVEAVLPDAQFYIAAQPRLSALDLERARNLKATIEVSGAFLEGMDYEACFARGVEVLSCAPGFRESVAEMTMAMILAGARGLVDQHEAFRRGAERWLDDREGTDFTLFDAPIGYIGYGQIARETNRLLAPFRTRPLAYDPFLKTTGDGTSLCNLQTLVEQSRVIVVAAVPSEETRGILSRELIARMQPGTLVVVISRAWCVDFPALVEAAEAGHIRVATDVFPHEPLTADDPLRESYAVIRSPHRAAAVPGGRHLIGEMILHDVCAILEERPERQLKAAHPAQVASLVAAQQGIAAQ
jgi:phosphoglycerate dehydrogenase-like enzyme